MDKRSWPWKRKSSDKASGDSDSVRAGLSNKEVKQEVQEHTKPVSFVQISVEKYEHFNGLEEKVEILKEKLNEVKIKLSSAQADMATKDDMVKQHAKVADEAISGWEKAEAETLALKHQLEAVTLLKLTAEERETHLDRALKECMKQLRNVKEEGEKKLHDVVFAKTKLWENIKSELEDTVSNFEQELLKNSAETAALSRSLQEQSVSLMKISEEKAQTDTEIEVLRTNIQSYEREINSLKYELNIAAKESEIRNEEKNMSLKAAEVANKQHIDDVKKMMQLEAECQRLRGLVRKKLPGPAALAQMKLEVEGFGHGYGESRRQSGTSSISYPFLSQEVNTDELERCRKENDLLTAQLLAMEEEIKMLKEALLKKHEELQDSYSMCAKTANKLRILEAQNLVSNQRKSPLKTNGGISFEGFSSQNESNRSLASMSEDGIDDAGSSAESWASTLISELPQFKKEKISVKSKVTLRLNQLELMDDFLEMERLAGLSSEKNGVAAVSDDGMEKTKNVNCDESSSVDVHIDVCKEQTPPKYDSIVENQPLAKLLSNIQARITSLVESKVFDSETETLEEIMMIMQDALNERSLQSKDHLNVEASCCIEAAEYETSLKNHSNSRQEIVNSFNQDLRNAVSWIHDFVLLLNKEATQGKSFELQATREKLGEFTDSVNKFFCNNLKPADFIHSLCHVLSEIKELRSNTDCFHDSMKETIPSSESISATPSFLFEELKNLRTERENIKTDLINCEEALEHAKLQLTETEQNLAELKRQLTSCRKSNDLADTQLRCMTESYKLLESRVEELEAEVNLLKSKSVSLENELIVERHRHLDDLAKIISCSKCSSHLEADADSKARQEREIAAAVDKLAACQETIILLNKQINALHPPMEEASKGSHFGEEDHNLLIHNSQQSHHSAIESDAVSRSANEEFEPPLYEYSSQFSTSDMELSPTLKPTASTKPPKHRPRSASASSLSSMLNDKPVRRISRFFSKEKIEF